MPSPKELLGDRYFIKMVRADALDYWRYEAIVGLTRSPQNQKKFPLRKDGKAGKGKYTVIGKIYDRASKPPTLSDDERKDFSQHQSFSLVDESKGIVPHGFGTTRGRNERLLGIAINKKDIRLNRLFRYDGGTYGRPYDFNTKEEAEEFLKAKVYGYSKNPKLFPPDKLEEYVESLKNNRQDQYNEPMAYARWNTDATSFIIVASDNLESRLLAIERSRILYKRLQEQAKEKGNALAPDYQVPIAFYLPNTGKHLQYYTPADQARDIEIALQIINDPYRLKENIESQNYEILLALEDPSMVLEGKLDQRIGINIVDHMIKNGCLNVVLSLYEKSNQAAQNSFKIQLSSFNKKFAGYYKDFDLEFLQKNFLFSFDVNDKGEFNYYLIKKHPDPTMWPSYAMEIDDEVFQLIESFVAVNDTSGYQKLIKDISPMVMFVQNHNNSKISDLIVEIAKGRLNHSLPYSIGSGGSVFDYQELEAVIVLGNKELISRIQRLAPNFSNQPIFTKNGTIFHPEARPYKFTYPAMLAFRNLQFDIVDQLIPSRTLLNPFGDFNENLLMHMIYELKFLRANNNNDAHPQAIKYITRLLENLSDAEIKFLNVQRTNGQTVLHLLVANDPTNIDLFKKMILAGCNPYIKDATGKTALDYLAQMKEPASQQFARDLILLDRRIDKLKELVKNSSGIMGGFSKFFDDSKMESSQELAGAKKLKDHLLTGNGIEDLRDVFSDLSKTPLAEIYNRRVPSSKIERGPQ